jgi:predicted ester cyclase
MLIACQSKTETAGNANYPENAAGYNLDSTANTETVINTIKAMQAWDTAKYRSYYANDAKFHDNLDSMSLDQNVQMISTFKEHGVSVKIISTSPNWEVVNKVASPDGVTNYVVSYITVEFIKGDKSVKVLMNTVDAFKDGKIVEEWNTYDASKMYDLLK